MFHNLLTFCSILLTISITLFIAVHITIMPQLRIYYTASKIQMIFLVNTFSVCHLIVLPILSFILGRGKDKSKEKLGMQIVVFGIALVLLGLASIGRYLASTDYQLAHIWTIVGNVGIVPIILMLIKIYNTLPNINRIILTIAPALTFIYLVYQQQNTIKINYPILTQIQIRDQNINKINYLIAFACVLGCGLTLLLILTAWSKIKQFIINQDFNKQYDKELNENLDNYYVEITWEKIKDWTCNLFQFSRFVGVCMFLGAMKGFGIGYAVFFSNYLKNENFTPKQVLIICSLNILSLIIMPKLIKSFGSNTKYTKNSQIFIWLNISLLLSILFTNIFSKNPFIKSHQITAIISFLLIGCLSSIQSLSKYSLQSHQKYGELTNFIMCISMHLAIIFSINSTTLTDISFSSISFSVRILTCIAGIFLCEIVNLRNFLVCVNGFLKAVIFVRAKLWEIFGHLSRNSSSSKIQFQEVQLNSHREIGKDVQNQFMSP